MYESFYGLTHKPFQLNPDPSFYFGSRQHKRAMSFLEYGLHQNEGFIVITGEVGAGKTTLVRSLLGGLSSEELIAVNLVSTQLGADDMLRMVAAAFGIKTKDTNKSQLLLSIEAFLTAAASKGKRALLIVDEAQNLTAQAVEELRMLSNFQLETHALLQSFLVGQPEFRQMLESPEMLQLRQRVIAACHIGAMDMDETQGYVEHRLTCVGWKNSPQIEADAYRAIHEASNGIPRRINSICDRLLLSGFLSNKQSFSAADVIDVAAEFKEETSAPMPVRGMLANPGRLANSGAMGTSRQFEQHFDTDLRSVEDAYRVVSKNGHESLDERLHHLEQGLIRLETTLLRVERGNTAAMAQFRSLVEWLRTHETERDELR
jgi:putative secretion ATPase (PEP-CTERM system associated)